MNKRDLNLIIKSFRIVSFSFKPRAKDYIKEMKIKYKKEGYRAAILTHQK